MILSRMMEYYRRKDTDLLEKAILNIDLNSCPNILEVRHVCETEYLTSALIHILTNLFDADNEVIKINIIIFFHLEHCLSIATVHLI
jgi:hypothetical protein